MKKYNKKNFTIEKIAKNLILFWEKYNVSLMSSIDFPKGAITLHPQIVFSAIEGKSRSIMMFERCNRPNDAMNLKFGCRLAQHHQFQVFFVNSSLENKIQLYRDSIDFLFREFSINQPYLDFIDSNWKHEALKASGIGWEVRYGGIEISQITYFQSISEIELKTEVLEFTYGVERLAMILQKCYIASNLLWNENETSGDFFNILEYDSFNVKSFNDISENLDQRFNLHLNAIDMLAEKRYFMLSYIEFMLACQTLNLMYSYISKTQFRDKILHVSNKIAYVLKQYVSQLHTEN